ncbi:First ORF in partial transposon ISC1160 [Saccharolobus solfataricus P2]|uniref:First ORF in partial transposon ISC1160 n=2 Tax=Saccharolobus solfataricus TaxID=2287 RepID=Q97U73_SACS2|nr:First ORF in partial transposon ISC1160 [Saccharolobus solfataricus P2]SAI86792.1 ORF1 in transposon ISC1160 [Saccharolobus solfataricus]
MSNIRFWKNNRNYSFVRNSTTKERFKVRRSILPRSEFQMIILDFPHLNSANRV